MKIRHFRGGHFCGVVTVFFVLYMRHVFPTLFYGKIGEIPLLLHFEFYLANAKIGGFITLHFRRTVFYFAPKFSPLLVNTYHYITVTLSSSPYHNFHVNIFQPPLPIKVSIFKYFTSEFLFYFSHPDI